ncbi:DUF2218 domain-containing protein [Roseibium sp. M-1]
MFIVTSTARTASASKYLQQLCKHFAHKVPAEWDTETGEVSFPFGHCRMEASPVHLSIRCEADEEQKIARMKLVIDDHLERFAWKEKLKLTWCEAEAPGRD